MDIDTNVLYPLQAAMEQWTDGRIIPAADLESVLLFLLYSPVVLSQSGMRFLGFACRQKGDQWLLTIKAREGDTPLVGFVTANTPTGCMCRWLDLIEDDRFSWRSDKYPWI